jgi:glucose/arabinose dehydrogenase
MKCWLSWTNILASEVKKHFWHVEAPAGRGKQRRRVRLSMRLYSRRVLPTAVLMVAAAFLALGHASRISCAQPLPIIIGPSNETVKLETFVSGLSFPTDIVPLPDGSGRLAVATLGGDVRLLDSTTGALLDTAQNPFLSVDVIVSEDFGMTALAFAPDYGNPGTPGFGKVFVNVPRPSGESAVTMPPHPSGSGSHQDVLREYATSAPGSNNPTFSSRDVFVLDQPSATHNFVDMEFNPTDGYLYGTSGDGAFISDAPQQLSNLYGVVFRIDPFDPSETVGSANPVSTNGDFRIPIDNPYLNDGNPNTMGEIWANGFRSPFRMHFDREFDAQSDPDGYRDLYVGDVGQSLREEVDFVSPGGNYGWPEREGTLTQGQNDPSFIDPIFEYTHNDGISVVGGFVYRGTALPQLQGKYIFGEIGQTEINPTGRLFYGDLATHRIFEFNLDPTGQLLNGKSIITIGQDENGELLLGVSDIGLGDPNAAGLLLKLVPGGSTPPTGSGVITYSESDPIGNPAEGPIDTFSVLGGAVQVVHGAESGSVDWNQVYSARVGEEEQYPDHTQNGNDQAFAYSTDGNGSAAIFFQDPSTGEPLATPVQSLFVGNQASFTDYAGENGGSGASLVGMLGDDALWTIDLSSIDPFSPDPGESQIDWLSFATGSSAPVDRIVYNGVTILLDDIAIGSSTTVSSWQTSGLGEWSNPSNWSGGNVPDTPSESASFGTRVTTPTVVVSDQDVTVGAINFNSQNNYTIVGAGTLTLAGGATTALINVGDANVPHEFQIAVNFASDADIVVQEGSTLTFQNRVDVNGHTLTISGGGTLTFNNEVALDGGSISMASGALSGSGSLAGDLQNIGGTVAPGNSPGVLTIQGNYTQGPDGTLLIELGVNEHDTLIVLGIAQLAGTLDIQLVDSFVPSADVSFQILDVGGLQGHFDRLVLPAGVVWDTSRLYTAGVLAVAAVPEPSAQGLLATLVAITPLIARRRWF